MTVMCIGSFQSLLLELEVPMESFGSFGSQRPSNALCALEASNHLSLELEGHWKLPIIILTNKIQESKINFNFKNFENF